MQDSDDQTDTGDSQQVIQFHPVLPPATNLCKINVVYELRAFYFFRD